MTTTTTPETVPGSPADVQELPVGSPAKFSWEPEDVAAALHVSVRHLTNVRTDDPTFPAPRLLGTLPRWSPDAIRHWLAGTPAASTPPTEAEATTTKPTTSKPTARGSGGRARSRNVNERPAWSV